MAQTLAEILIETKTAELNKDRDLKAARLATETAESQAEHAKVLAFFNASQEYFTQQIINKAPTKEISVLVGQTGNKTANNDISYLLSFGRGDFGSHGGEQLSKSCKFYYLWEDFVAWAKEQGLEPRWSYCHDGAGYHSWYVLRVVPLGTPLAKKH